VDFAAGDTSLGEVYGKMNNQHVAKWMRFAAVLTMLCIVLVPRVVAQAPLAVRIDEARFDEASNTVEIRVTVSDANGYAITGLGQHKEQFQVYEDGVLFQDDLSVLEKVNPDTPVHIALVLDLSGSMEGEPLADLKAAVNKFLDALTLQDTAAVIAFSNEVDLGDPFPKINPEKEADFTYDKGLLKNLVNRLSTKPGDTTPLYDAFLKAVRMTRSQPKQNRAIILMTDGVDEGAVKGQPGSKVANPDDPLTLAREAGIPVYTVGLGKPTHIDEGYLQRVALLTGGMYKGTEDSAQLEVFFKEVIDLLKTEYRLTYPPLAKPDGKTHQVSVKVSLPERGVAQSEPKTFQMPLPTVPQVYLNYWEGNDRLPLADGQKVRGSAIRFSPQIMARGVIMRVEYYVDDSATPVVVEEPPFDFVWRTGAYDTGIHKITVKAYDDAAPPQVGTLEISVQLVRSALEELGKKMAGPVGKTGIPVYVVALVVLLMLAAVVLLLWPKKRRCPVCGRVMPRNWDHCLFCERGGRLDTTPNVGLGEGRPTRRELPATSDMREARPSPGLDSGASFTSPQKTILVARPPETLAYLFMEKGTHVGKEFRLTEVTSIGRAEDNLIVLDDPAVGRYQAKIKLEDGNFFVYDLAATNPTLVNGQRILKHKLSDGDRIHVGETVLVFKAI